MSDVKNKLNEKSTSTDEMLSNIIAVINNNYSVILDKYIEKTAGGSDGHRGDFILSFDDNLCILIENKFYVNNVNTKEVQKFKDDVIKCGTCGIMLS